jgi:hypothetical protein
MLVEPALYCLKNILMLPTGDPALLACGAAVLDGAALASIGRDRAYRRAESVLIKRGIPAIELR